MTENRSLSPAPLAWLVGGYPSSQKGGTLIAEDVWDLATHERCLHEPERYRPSRCGRCGAKVHLHDLRVRLLLGDPAVSTEVIRFRCADREECGAAWLILPAFLARHLWRSWSRVETAISTVISTTVEPTKRSKVPERTLRRWKSRLTTSARQLVTLLNTAMSASACAVATAAGLDASRLDLVRAYRAETRPGSGRCLAELSGFLHRLCPGVRLM